MKIQAIALILMAGLCVAACNSHKPAYSNINTNQAVRPENLPPDTTNESAPAPAPNPPAVEAAPTPPGPIPAVRTPAFLDGRKGEARDMPNYPGSIRKNIQYGPMGELDMFSILLQTHDPADKIAAYYDKIIKSNAWIVKSRVVDPEYCEWVVLKDDDNGAKVIVKKDAQSNSFYINLVRTGRPSPASQPAPPKPQS